MKYDTGKVIAAIGAVLVVLGLILGFVPQSARGITCGSPFITSKEASVADFADAIQADSLGLRLDEIGANQAACDDKLSTWRIVTWLFIGLGVGLWLVSVVVKPSRLVADDDADG